MSGGTGTCGTENLLCLSVRIPFIGDLFHIDANHIDDAAGAKAMFPAKIFWASCSACVRLSLLVLYYRLLNHLDMKNWRYRWAIHVNTFIVVGILMSYIFTTVFACNSVAQYWHWPP